MTSDEIPRASTATSTFECDRCSKCCRHHRVPVTLSDIRRLRRSVDAPISNYLELLAPDSIDILGEPETLFETRQGLRLLVLKYESSGCSFLTAQGCSVHSSRPRACRSYPFDRPQHKNEELNLHPEPLCPVATGMEIPLRIGVQGPALQTRHAAIADLNQRDTELDHFALQVQSYNNKQQLRRRLGRLPRSEQELLDWLDTQSIS